MDIASLNVKVKSEGIQQTTNQLNSLGTAAANTEKKVQNLVDAVDKMVKQFAAGASSTKAMTDALSVVNRSTQASDAALKSLTTSVTNLQREITSLNGRLQQGSGAVNQSTVTIVHNTAAMNDAHAAARGLSGSLGALWLTYGNVIPLAAGAAIGASLKAIVTVGVDVQSTLENIRVRTESTIEEVALLGKTISDLGQGIYGPQEVAKALETLTLAGLSAKQAVTAIGAALNLATSGGTTIEKSAEALVTIGTAVGATSAEYDYLADAIQKTANISLASVDSIAETVKRASVVNKLYGASFEDILTQSAALAQLGIKNTAAGTAITNFYANARAETEKAKKAVDALGFSFQDTNGKVKEIVPAIEGYAKALNKFDLNSQKELITAQFGERSLRDIQALISLYNTAAESQERLADGTLKYKNRLEEIQAQVQDSAGAAVIAASQQALSTENLFKATANSLKTSLGDAFKVIEPDVQRVSRILRDGFASQEFKTAVENVARGFVSVAKAIAENIGPLTMLVELFLTYKAIVAGGALFTTMIPAIEAVGMAVLTLGGATQTAAVGMSAMGVATATTTTSMLALTRVIPGIGAALAAATAVFALYSLHAKDATDNTTKLAESKRQAAVDYNTDFLKSLSEEATRIELVNEQISKGITLTDAQTEANKRLALEKQKDINNSSVDAAQKALNDAQRDVSRLSSSSGTGREGEDLKNAVALEKALKQVTIAQKLLNAAKTDAAEADRKALEDMERIRKGSAFQQSMIRAQTLGAELEARERAGSQTFNPEADKAAQKQLTFLEEEQRQLKLLAAGYQARGDALIKSYLAGEKIAADTQQARIKVNQEEGKYASDKIAAQELILAKNADEKKDYEERAKIFTELGFKTQGIIAGEKAAQEAFAKGDTDRKGNLERQANKAADFIKLTVEQRDAFVEQAAAAELINKAIEYRIKLESETKSAGGRADALMAQAEAMSEYGSKAKFTALDLAKGKVAQEEFTDAITKGAQAAYIASAAYETAAKALVNITKIGQQSAEDEEKAQADSLLIFADTEKKKVEIKANSAKRIIASNLAQAESAAGTGDEKAIDAYEKAKISSVNAIAQIDRTTILKTHNIELEDWKKTANQIVDATIEGFERSRDQGLSIWKSLTNSIKDMFKKTIFDYIKKEFAKPILLNLVASTAGTLGFSSLSETAGKMAGSSSGSSAISLASAANNIYKAISGGFDGLASSISNVAQSGLNLLGPNSGFYTGEATSGIANTSLANGIGTAGSAVAGIAGGIYGGRAISGGYSALGSSGNTAVNISTIVGAVVGGPLGALIGGLIGGSVNRLFGHKAKEIQSQGIRGTLSGDAATGENYANWIQKGGLFRSDKKGTETSAITSDIQNTLTSSFNQLKSTVGYFAKDVGVGTSALDGFTKQFDIAFGTDAQKNQEAVTKFFTDLGDEFVTKLIPNISDFARQGETASQTLERLSATFKITNQIVEILGKTGEQAFGSVGLASDKARERLIDLAGGIDKLGSKVTAYASDFLTDAEKIAPVKKAVNEALTSLGLAGVTTKEQFKNIVNGLDLTSEAGAKLFNDLLDLAPAFAQVADAADSAAQAAKDAAEAAEEAQKAAFEAAMKAVDASFNRLKKSVDAQKSVENDRYNQEVAFIKAVGEARKNAAQTELDTAKQTVSTLSGILSSLQNALVSTKVESVALDKARRVSAQTYLASIRGTDLSKASGLNDALGNVSGDSKQFFATFEEYALDQAKTANLISGLVNETTISKSFAELTVERLNDTITAIQNSTDAQLSAAESHHNDEIAKLDKVIDAAQLQIDALNGIQTAVLSVTSAIANFNAAVNAAVGAGGSVGGNPSPTYSGTGSSGSIPSNGGGGLGSMYVNPIGSGTGGSESNPFFWENTVWDFMRNGAYVDGSHASGLGYVPFDGYIAELHKGERVMTAADNANLSRQADSASSSSSQDINSLKASIEDLKQAIVSGDIAVVGYLREMLQIDRRWDQDGLPATREV
jgi:TP901 family phage tail tape measure protein